MNVQFDLVSLVKQITQFIKDDHIPVSVRSHGDEYSPLYHSFDKLYSEYQEILPQLKEDDILYQSLLNLKDTTVFIYDIKFRMIENGEKKLKKYQAMTSQDYATIKIKDGDYLPNDMPIPDFMDNCEKVYDTFYEAMILAAKTYNAAKDFLDVLKKYGYESAN